MSNLRTGQQRVQRVVHATFDQIRRRIGEELPMLLEGRGGRSRNGRWRRDGYAVRGDASMQWAVYRIVCYRRLTVAQAATARRMLGSLVPARCALSDIDFSKAILIRNGLASRDGLYNRGSV